MRFRRNIKDERSALIASILAAIAAITLTIIYFINKNKNVLDFIFPLVLIAVVSLACTFVLRKSYVKFEKNMIIIENNKAANISIKISDVRLIMIPTQKALKNKFKENAIIIKRVGTNNIISYTKEVEVYIKENLKIDIEYYDNYTKALKEKF